MSSQPSAPGRVAGVDFGTVRIGIAITNPERSIASPLENYTRGSPERDAQRFRRLVADEGVVLFVVGLPIHLDGGESQKSQEARKFGQWLAETTGVPDMLAAQIMLSAYLESQAGREEGGTEKGEGRKA